MMIKMSTEEVLNRRGWADSWGNVTELEDMTKEHLQNVLYYLYKNRDRYWFNCKDASLIDRFKDGDEFFQLVIRKSTLWTSIIEILESPEEGFNFAFYLPER